MYVWHCLTVEWPRFPLFEPSKPRVTDRHSPHDSSQFVEPLAHLPNSGADLLDSMVSKQSMATLFFSYKVANQILFLSRLNYIRLHLLDNFLRQVFYTILPNQTHQNLRLPKL